MSKYLNTLSASTTSSIELLQKAYMDWLGASSIEQERFIGSRKNLVKKMGGCFLEGSDALKMQSSGTTNGSKKTYYWGPSWMSHHNFFEWLKFQPYDFDLLLYIKPVMGIESISFTSMPIINKMSYIVAIDPKKAVKHSEELKKHVGNRKVIFWLMPSYAKLLVDRGFKFELFPPEANYIYATGEPSPSELRLHFTTKGYHYIDAMRSWMGGATFITCEHGKTHWIKMLADVSTNSNNELIVTDLFNLAQPFINFETTDYVKWIEGSKCKCGLVDNEIEFLHKDITLPLEGSIITFVDLFNELNKVIALRHKTLDMNPLLFCSFGYHQSSNTLFIMYEVKKNVPLLNQVCLKEFVKTTNFLVKKVCAINNYRANQFKVTKIFHVSDREAVELERIATTKVGI